MSEAKMAGAKKRSPDNLFHIQFPAQRDFISWTELACLARALGFPTDVFRSNANEEVDFDDDGISCLQLNRMLDLKLLHQPLHRTCNLHTSDWNTCVLRKALKYLTLAVFSFEEVYNIRVAYSTYEAGDMKGLYLEQHTIVRTLKLCNRAISPKKLSHRLKHMKASLDEPCRLQLYEFFDLILWCDYMENRFNADDMTPQKGKDSRDLYKLDDFETVLSHQDQRRSRDLDQRYLAEEWEFGQERLGSNAMFRGEVVKTDHRISQAKAQKRKYRHLKKAINQSQRLVLHTNVGAVKDRPISAPELLSHVMSCDSSRSDTTSVMDMYRSMQRRWHSAPSGVYKIEVSDRPVLPEYVRVQTPCVVTAGEIDDVTAKMQSLEFDMVTLESRCEMRLEEEKQFYLPGDSDSHPSLQGDAAADRLEENEHQRTDWEDGDWSPQRNRQFFHPSPHPSLHHLHHPLCDDRFHGWTSSDYSSQQRALTSPSPTLSSSTTTTTTTPQNRANQRSIATPDPVPRLPLQDTTRNVTKQDTTQQSTPPLRPNTVPSPSPQRKEGKRPAGVGSSARTAKPPAGVRGGRGGRGELSGHVEEDIACDSKNGTQTVHGASQEGDVHPDCSSPSTLQKASRNVKDCANTSPEHQPPPKTSNNNNSKRKSKDQVSAKVKPGSKIVAKRKMGNSRKEEKEHIKPRKEEKKEEGKKTTMKQVHQDKTETSTLQSTPPDLPDPDHVDATPEKPAHPDSLKSADQAETCLQKSEAKDQVCQPQGQETGSGSRGKRTDALTADAASGPKPATRAKPSKTTESGLMGAIRLLESIEEDRLEDDLAEHLPSSSSSSITLPASSQNLTSQGGTGRSHPHARPPPRASEVSSAELKKDSSRIAGHHHSHRNPAAADSVALGSQDEGGRPPQREDTDTGKGSFLKKVTGVTSLPGHPDSRSPKIPQTTFPLLDSIQKHGKSASPGEGPRFIIETPKKPTRSGEGCVQQPSTASSSVSGDSEPGTALMPLKSVTITIKDQNSKVTSTTRMLGSPDASSSDSSRNGGPQTSRPPCKKPPAGVPRTDPKVKVGVDATDPKPSLRSGSSGNRWADSVNNSKTTLNRVADRKPPTPARPASRASGSASNSKITHLPDTGHLDNRHNNHTRTENLPPSSSSLSSSSSTTSSTSDRTLHDDNKLDLPYLLNSSRSENRNHHHNHYYQESRNTQGDTDSDDVSTCVQNQRKRSIHFSIDGEEEEEEGGCGGSWSALTTGGSMSSDLLLKSVDLDADVPRKFVFNQSTTRRLLARVKDVISPQLSARLKTGDAGLRVV